jgi:predicted amidohydrolase
VALKIATTQLPARRYGLETIERYLKEADDQEVDIVCFPEGYLNGYTRVESEAKARAIDFNSDDFMKILKNLGRFRATAVIGVIEVEGEKLFNTAIVVKGGVLLGKYRKTHPQEGIFEAGRDYPVFAIKGHKFGINICYDANFPEATQRLIEQGAEIIFYPLNNELKNESAEKWRYRHIKNLAERAKDAGVMVISSDVIVETEATTGYGCTAIVSKRGEIIAKEDELREGMQMVAVSS